MALNIGSASLQIGGNVGGLQSALSSALQSVQTFSAGVRTALAQATGGFSELLGLVTTIIGAVSLAGFVNQIRNVGQEVKQLNDEAHAFGVSFNFMASLQSGGIENAAHSFRHLSQEVQKATEGNIAAQVALMRVGVTAEQLVPMNAEQRISAILSSIQRMPPGMERTAAAMQLLGRNAGPILARLDQGGDAIARMREEANRFGTTLSESQLKGIEQMNDGWRQVKESITGVWRQVTAAVAPFFAAIFGFIARVIQAGRRMMQPFLGMVQGIGTVVNQIAQLFFSLFDTLSGIFDAFGVVIDVIKGIFTTAFRIMVESVRPLGIAIGYAMDIFKMAVGAVLTNAVAPLLRGFQTLIDALGAMVDTFAAFSDWIPGVGGMIAEANRAMGRFRDNVQGMARDVEGAGRGLGNVRLGEGANRINAFFDGLVGRAPAAAGAAAEGVATITNAVNESILQLDRANRNFQRTREEVMMADIRARPDFVDNGANRRELDRLQQAMDRNMSQTLTAQVDPTVQLATELTRLEGLFRRNAISAEAFAMQNNRVLMQAERAVGLGKEIKPEQAIQQGTSQAFEVVARFQLAGQNQRTPEERREAIQNEQRNIARQQLEIQQAMLRALNPAAVPAVL